MVLEAEPENSSKEKTKSPKTNSLFLTWWAEACLLPNSALPTPILLSPLSQYGAIGISFSRLYKC